MDRNIQGCRTKRERVEIAAQLKKPMYIHRTMSYILMLSLFNAICTYIMQYLGKNGCNVLLKVKWYFRTRRQIRYFAPRRTAWFESAYNSYLWKMKNRSWKWGKLSQFLGLLACLSVLPGLCLIIGYRDGIHGIDVKGRSHKWHLFSYPITPWINWLTFQIAYKQPIFLPLTRRPLKITKHHLWMGPF